MQWLSPKEQYDRIDIPILTITGHYDDDQPGAMEYYRKHMDSSSSSKSDHYLLIGPWDHAGTRDPKTEFGGVKFSDGCHPGYESITQAMVRLEHESR